MAAAAFFAIYKKVGLPYILLAGGILLLRRRAVARNLLLAYACAALAIGIVRIAVMLASHDFGATHEMLGARMVGRLCGAGAIIAYPVFLLVWLMRAKIRQEVLAWRAAA